MEGQHEGDLRVPMALGGGPRSAVRGQRSAAVISGHQLWSSADHAVEGCGRLVEGLWKAVEGCGRLWKEVVEGGCGGRRWRKIDLGRAVEGDELRARRLLGRLRVTRSTALPERRERFLEGVKRWRVAVDILLVDFISH